jgi:hypothetical protein
VICIIGCLLYLYGRSTDPSVDLVKSDDGYTVAPLHDHAALIGNWIRESPCIHAFLSDSEGKRYFGGCVHHLYLVHFTV